MIINLANAARLIPLTALILAACVSGKAGAGSPSSGNSTSLATTPAVR
jgi:hypothetical protein